MDFVLRDAYMSGYSVRAFDLDRLLHYSFFTPEGLTIHERGLSALVRFIAVRAELFRTIYFHRTVRAIDLALQELFARQQAAPLSRQPAGAPRRVPAADRMVAAGGGGRLASQQPIRRCGSWAGGGRTSCAAGCAGRWPSSGRSSSPRARRRQSSVFSSERAFEMAVRERLPRELRDLPLRVDTARHVHRPGAHAPAAGQNFLYDPATGKIRSLDDRELFRRIAISYRICRIYAEDHRHNAELAAAMDQITGGGADD